MKINLAILLLINIIVVACNSSVENGASLNNMVTSQKQKTAFEVDQEKKRLGTQIFQPKFYVYFYNYTSANLNINLNNIYHIESISSNNPIILANGGESTITFISAGVNTSTAGIQQNIPGTLQICANNMESNPYCFTLTRLSGDRPFFLPGIQSFDYAYLTRLDLNPQLQIWAYYYDPTDLGYDVNDFVCRNLTDIYSQNTGGYMQSINNNSQTNPRTSFEFYIYDQSESIESNNACTPHN